MSFYKNCKHFSTGLTGAMSTCNRFAPIAYIENPDCSECIIGYKVAKQVSGFKDKRLQEIWDSLGLPADVGKQERFEREIHQWADSSMHTLEGVLRRYMSSFDCESMKGFDCTGIDCIKCPFNSGNAERFAIAWTREINEGGH